MSHTAARTSHPSWLNSLLGAVLLAIAVLDLLMVAFVGWAAWERAALSERLVRMRQEDPLQLQGDQLEIQELQALIARSRQTVATSLAAFPTDADIARAAEDLRLRAESQGATIVELSPQPCEPTTIPTRRFSVRIDGDWAVLCWLLGDTVQTALPTTRIEQVTLQQHGNQAQIAFQLQATVRPPEPWPFTTPLDPNVQVP